MIHTATWNKLIDLLELKAIKICPQYEGNWVGYFNEKDQYINAQKNIEDFSYIKCGLCNMIVTHPNYMDIFNESHVIGHVKEFNLLPFI